MSSSLRVPELKALLRQHGLSTSGLKNDLVARCREQLPDELRKLEHPTLHVDVTATVSNKRYKMEPAPGVMVASHEQKIQQELARVNSRENTDRKMCEDLFSSLAGGECEELDGLTLCDALEVNPESLSAIAVSYYLGSKNLGSFPKMDMVQKLFELRIFTLQDLKAHLPQWEKNVAFDTGRDFEKVYAFAFKWGIKLSKEEKAQLMGVLVPHTAFKQMDLWQRYWNTPEQAKIGKDDWNSFPRLVRYLRGVSRVQNAQLSEESWPSAYLDFVDWAKRQQ